MLKFKKVEKFSEVFYNAVSNNINQILNDSTKGLSVHRSGYEVVSTDGDVIGHIFDIDRPPLGRGFYQDHGWIFIGNTIHNIFSKRLKDVKEQVKEDYKKYE